MADALVSVVLEQLTSIVATKLSEELKLLKGVEKDIHKLITDLETITAVLDDAEKRRVKESAVEIWVDQLKQVCYDIEDVLDEWRTETIQKQPRQPPKRASWLIKKVISWISSHLPWIRRPVWKHNIALRIKDINERLDVVGKEKDRFKFTPGTTASDPERPKTTSFIDVSEIYGRDHVKESLTNRLLSEISQEKHNLSITAIVGMGGIGKTTLAQLAYNDENVKKHFDKRIWVCVSDPFNATNIARAIIEGLGIKGRTSDLVELQSMLQEISAAIKNQKFLLILDDVWNENRKRWEPFRNCLENGAQGSKILVTTRSERVASIMEATKTIPLKELSTEECWSIFSQIAFFERSDKECKDLENIGRKMSERCKGLPLAAKVLGGLMRFKRSRVEWQNVLDSDLWELEEANKELDPVFMLSYYDLPSPMKRCFTYCAIFPEDHVLWRNRLIQLWMANGFLRGREVEITGDEYIESMAMRSLFQDLRRDISGRIEECKMHDLVREFALRLSRNECGAIEVYKGEEELMMKQEQEPAYAKLRHARLTFKGGDHSSSSALSKFSINGLRTLLITERFNAAEVGTTVLGGLFCGLTSLRTLELSYSQMKELPTEIGKLMHLRYLGLGGNYDLETLPEMTCDLFNLQTLNLTSCSKIKRLPTGIWKLLNLRHLKFELTGITKLPKGIGELTSLRTLAGPVFYKREKDEYFGIGDLEKLNCLQGYLSLKHLGDVEFDNVGEAKRARLKNKKNLRSLQLVFNESWNVVAEEEAEEERAKRHLLIAEALLEEEAPPPHLEELGFAHYRGTELPSWVTCLSGLKLLELSDCPNLKELPGDFWERLPLHRKMHIYGCPALADYCPRRMTEDCTLPSLFAI